MRTRRMLVPATIICGLILAGLSLGWAAAAGGTGAAPAKKEEAAGPLKLEILVLLPKTPATLVFRATNISKEPVSVERFRHPKNHVTVVMPSGKERSDIVIVDGFGKVPPEPPIVLQPGKSEEWEVEVGSPLAFFYGTEAGTSRLRWQINDQTSGEVLLYKRPIR
jgi:hypothetical protein